MDRKVVVCPYQPEWDSKFCIEAQLLKDILGKEMTDIHHIGSTAVKGLWAKPIIDILIEVNKIEDVDAYNSAFVLNGYIPKGENGIPGRRYFVKSAEEIRTHHVHIYQKGHLRIERHLALIAYLSTFPERVDAYAKLKRMLATKFPENIDAYVDGKDAFVKHLEQQALDWYRSTHG